MFSAVLQVRAALPWALESTRKPFQPGESTVFIVAIAEEGAITAAANRLRVAQSARSRQIGDLEDAFKIQIFERDRAGTTLTPAGESLLRFARDCSRPA
jgi:molybdenum-dependent DNA-binding transcriptional regulator ModE